MVGIAIVVTRWLNTEEVVLYNNVQDAGFARQRFERFNSEYCTFTV